MKHINFYFDFISPYAYLAFEKLPEALMGQSYSVTYRPILFAALLQHHGQLGPAEIPPKRDWTYRQVQWLAHSQAIGLDLPASHPFNPLALLRLAVACGMGERGGAGDGLGASSRYVTEAIFRFVWQGGADPCSPVRLADLIALLGPKRDISGDEVKAALKSNTGLAISLGLFGVPTFEVDGKLFWGLDALPMLRDYLAGDAWFDGPVWQAASQLPVGIVRPK